MIAVSESSLNSLDADTPTRRYVPPNWHILIATFREQDTSSKVATFPVGCTVETYDYATRSN